MPKTIEGGPWDYLPVLNECIRILLTVAIGVLSGYLKVFDADTFVPQAVKFIFSVALPLHIARGIGIVVDFYDDSLLWSYISAFLILRAIFLLISIGLVVLRVKDGGRGYVGEVAVLWLSTTWISTVILGVPISEAVFGDGDKGLLYGLLAGISSFIFQLPLQLLFLECFALEQEYIEGSSVDTSKIGRNTAILIALPDEEEGHFVEDTVHVSEKETEGKFASKAVEENTMKTADEVVVPLMMWTQFARRGDVWRRILIRIVHNPVIWGIGVGFLLSLSTVGPSFLKPSSDDFVPGLGWIFRTCEWFGACVSPVSLFAMGVWVHDQCKKLFNIPLYSAFLFMFAKLFVVPLMMVGLAKALDLHDEAGRAAVLIAALPISMASFSLAGHYKIGHATLSANVVLGTALMLPTILIWDIVMDKLDLFPIHE